MGGSFYQLIEASPIERIGTTREDAAGFAVEKKSFPEQGGMTTKDETFAKLAFSSVAGSAAYQVTTLVAWNGSTVIQVSGKTTVAKEKVLLTRLFAKV